MRSVLFILVLLGAGCQQPLNTVRPSAAVTTAVPQ
jgi:hypothetical protein